MCEMCAALENEHAVEELAYDAGSATLLPCEMSPMAISESLLLTYYRA
jgi:hypothetical protein